MKKILSVIMTVWAVCGLTACSEKEEPETPANDGVAVYINAADMLYDSERKPAFTPTHTEGFYVAVAESLEISENYIRRLILDEDWDGSDITVDLDKNGSIRIMGETPELASEGVYNEIIVNFTDFVPFTLQIIDEERAKDDNGYIGTGVAKVQ